MRHDTTRTQAARALAIARREGRRLATAHPLDLGPVAADVGARLSVEPHRRHRWAA